jgi:cobalt/nickel transport system permease protein
VFLSGESSLVSREILQMHMADALISPAVGGAMWAVSSGLIAWSARKVKEIRNDRLIPMMGVMGAFIFTAQMINFSIPATGSSGHLGGGLMLSVLLGSYAAFLVIASVLTVQALFFADGGLLALGCNIFNLGFFPVFIAYPLIYRSIANGAAVGVRLLVASMTAAIVGLQAGAFGVVLETTLSGISDLPFRTFVIMMQPIHLAIGIVEGLATAAVVTFVARARPEMLVSDARLVGAGSGRKRVLVGLLIATVVMGGVVSWFASTYPDGLEWSISKVTGKEEVEVSQKGLHKKMVNIQEKTAFLPGYGFKNGEAGRESTVVPSAGQGARWPAVDAGTSVSGLLGGIVTFVVVGLIGYGLKARQKAV